MAGRRVRRSTFLVVIAVVAALVLALAIAWPRSSWPRSTETVTDASAVMMTPLPPSAVPNAHPSVAPVVRVAMDANASPDPETYGQVGYLTPGPLPLYGQASTARRGRWYYYTIVPTAGGGGSIKVPIRAGSRDCMAEVGCDELADGDVVSVPDAAGTDLLPGGPLTVRLYKLGVPRI